jgi:hypothetical protein
LPHTQRATAMAIRPAPGDRHARVQRDPSEAG